MNGDVVQAIVEAIAIPCQLGGGVRDEGAIEGWLERGVARLVIGTRAAKEPQWMQRMCRQFPDRLVLGVDARDGRVATDGWHTVCDLSAADLANQFSGLPLAGIVYTDISRDGMLQGPNLEAIRRLRDEVDVPIIASGGVTTTDDVLQLAQLNIEGCIIGRALYEGTLTLSDALSAALDTTNHS
jgi:phosphoribosylformimino-5-aminoimidazole carboxamide ribotide isomerase